jgi:macrodomain Ter protein organizer (MatP/YcbG family)
MKNKLIWELNTHELADATKQFDEPMVVDRSRPLTPEEREQWERAKRKRGRPRVGRGCKRVSISLEKGLLRRINAYAKKRRITRSGLVAEMFEELLSRNE